MYSVVISRTFTVRNGMTIYNMLTCDFKIYLTCYNDNVVFFLQ